MNSILGGFFVYTPGQKKAAIDILNAYTDNIPYITKQ